MNAEKTELFFIVKEERGNPFSHINIDVREATEADLIDAVRDNNIPFMFNSKYDGLSINNQYGHSYVDVDDTMNSKAYGYEIAYQLQQIKLNEAEKITKVLRSLNRKMDNLSRKKGSPVDYMDYISRVLGILKIHDAYFVSQKGNKFWVNGKMNVLDEIARLDKKMENGE